MSTDETRWHDVAETAKHFDVSKDTVYEACKSGRWPHRRVGTGPRAPIKFSPEDWQEIAELMRPVSVVAARTPRRPALSRIQRGMQRRAA